MTTKLVVVTFAVLAMVQSALDLMGLPPAPATHETRIEGPR